MIGKIVRSRKVKKFKKKIAIFFVKKIFHSDITENKLIRLFSNTGIKPGDQVMVHSSLSSMGVLRNDSSTFISAIKKYITNKGLIVMPTFSQVRMYEYVKSNECFDVNKSPSLTGKLTEEFRKSEGVVRSLHPTHSLSVWGKNAKQFVSGHEKCITPFNELSPYKKIIDENFKILFIGIDMFSMTICRAGDDMIDNYPVNPYLDQVFEINITDYSGKKLVMQTKVHDPQISARRRNMKIFPYLKEYIFFGKLAKAKTMMIHAKDVYNVQKDLAKRGISTYYDKPVDKI